MHTHRCQFLKNKNKTIWRFQKVNLWNIIDFLKKKYFHELNCWIIVNALFSETSVNGISFIKIQIFVLFIQRQHHFCCWKRKKLVKQKGYVFSWGIARFVSRFWKKSFFLGGAFLFCFYWAGKLGMENSKFTK